MSRLGKNPPLNRAQLESVKKVFKLYDNGTGKIDPHEVVNSMTYLKFDAKNPVIFELISSLDTPENSRNGLTYEDMVDQLNEALGDKESKKSVERVYNTFLGDSDKDVITFDVIKRVSREVGDEMSDEDINNLLERAGSNGKELTFDEFYALMTKKATL